ncbi:Potassium-transporting ATPase C chain [Caulifigura coniformis]|uniref:Potassium-transporting ATPase KdpC subunit n=1 Tax=Caulifigura coniformis TaxID=2527983 RepID=A0A517SLZ3_9PLAN|nr:potassium-transporting ATPase subunit KdpC [Caulifigura coniformis]QDT57128.1 Potassium-transporting ATPase C chain [Caulifigura coniformis]
MFQQLRTAISMLIVMTVMTGVVYPLCVTAVAQVAFPHEANGSLIREGADLVGSELIGQNFSQPRYFWGRLSATAPVPYNAAASGGSNLGPLNPALVDATRVRVDALNASEPSTRLIPVDLATASGSGLDPHISPAAAEIQVRRVAVARRMAEHDLHSLVVEFTEGRQFGLLGEPRVNVLKLNLALDRMSAGSRSR